MNFKAIIFSSTILLFSSCSNESIVKPPEEKPNSTKFSMNFRQTGHCEDALMDTLKRNQVQIGSESLKNEVLTVDFKYKSACCQKFAGYYTVKKDSVHFYFHQSNDEVCSCICWYPLQIKFSNYSSKMKGYSIKEQSKK